MTLRLVSSGDDRALAIRDHLAAARPRARHAGASARPRAAGRPADRPLDRRALDAVRRAVPGEASSPGYRHALERQRTRPDLPYGLDVRRDGARVLRVLWSDDGASEVAAFVRGSWEDDALALAL